MISGRNAANAAGLQGGEMGGSMSDSRLSMNTGNGGGNQFMNNNINNLNGGNSTQSLPPHYTANIVEPLNLRKSYLSLI